MKHPLQLLRHLTNESQYQYALDWLAFAIQNEGKARHATALVIHAPKGSGKTTFFKYFAENVAFSGWHINYKDLSRFWTILDDTSLLVIDGVPASALAANNLFTALICNTELQIAQKNQPQRTVINRLNIIILVNDDELPDLQQSRRYTVIKSDQTFDDWIRLEDALVFPLLLSEYLEAIEIKTVFPTIALPQPTETTTIGDSDYWENL